LCDVAWAAARWSGPGDGLWALAEAWGVATHLSAVLDTVERGLAVPITPPLRRPAVRPGLRRVATAAFLAAAPPEVGESKRQRVWAEIVWGVAMQCLRWNVLRAWR